jgi:hypothetical protein
MEDGQVVSNAIVKFIFLSTKKASGKLSDCKPIISLKEYNSLTGSKEELHEGQALNINLDWKPGNQGIEQGSIHELYAGSDIYSFEFIDSRRGNWIAGMTTFPSTSIIIINDLDYERIAEKISNNTGIKYYFISIQIFTVIFLVGRYSLYCTNIIRSGYQSTPYFTFIWTLFMGVCIGITYLMLGKATYSTSTFKSAVKFGVVIFGVNWGMFNIFIPIIIKGLVADTIIRIATDILWVILSYYLSATIERIVLKKNSA